MSPQRLLVTTFLLGTALAKVYDVTTIYRRDFFAPGRATLPGFPQASLEVHARTNALGLPFHLPNGTVLEPTAGVDVSSCNSWDESCSWTGVNWNLVTIDKEPAILPVDFSFQEQSDDTPEKTTRVFSLNGADGSFTSPKFVPNSDKLCVSMHHYLQPDSTAELEISTVNTDGSRVIVGKVHSKQITEWETNRFVAELTDSSWGQEIQLQVKASRTGTEEIYIERLSGCNPEANEDMALVLIEAIEDSDALSTPYDNGSCQHGGVWDAETSECICIPGFAGQYCQTGCGENRFGHDCLGACSDSDYGCKGLTLCKVGVGCSCAPGFHGPSCSDNCPSDKYGPSCQYSLGQCEITSGTQYTGVCQYGCKEGFYPPLCKDKYKFVASPPIVTPIGVAALAVDVDLSPSNLQGSGIPLFYKIQYKNESDVRWQELPPQTMTAGTKTGNITGLLSGHWYDVRVVLICEDFQSYEGKEENVVHVRTDCIVPENVNFSMTFHYVWADYFTMNWEYVEGPFWCPLDHFEVELKDSWRWTPHYQGILLQDSFSHLRPGTKYQVKMRAVTIAGPTSFTKPVTIKTQHSKPDLPFNMTLESVTSTSIGFSWESPRNPAGDIKEYHMFYSCMYPACPRKVCSSPGSVVTNETSYEFTDLTPLTQYTIQVYGMTGLSGSSSTFTVGTLQALPAVAPDPHQTPVTNIDTTSLTVQWKAPTQCDKLHGFLQGYRYRLAAGQWLHTSNTTVSVDGLTPNTTYTFEVVVVTSAGWDDSKVLQVVATTKS